MRLEALGELGFTEYRTASYVDPSAASTVTVRSSEVVGAELNFTVIEERRKACHIAVVVFMAAEPVAFVTVQKPFIW